MMGQEMVHGLQRVLTVQENLEKRYFEIKYQYNM
jgi:hypothetical protein